MKKIRLTSNQFALVDNEDFEMVNKLKWYASKTETGFRAQRVYKKQNIFMHRFIMGAVKGQEVDHKNGSQLDNRKINLRFCTRSQNMMNIGRPRHNKSGFKGVSFEEFTGKWKAQIQKDKKNFNLGRFQEKVEAAKAYNRAALEYFGEFARLNKLSK